MSSNTTVKGWKVTGGVRRWGETMRRGDGEQEYLQEGRRVGWGGDTLGSIHKSQKATKDGRGQVTFHLPSSSWAKLLK